MTYVWSFRFALLAYMSKIALSQDSSTTSSVGRVPCPTDPSILGYISTDALNQDIKLDIQLFLDGDSTPEFFHYILCPNTTFKIADRVGQGAGSDGESYIILGSIRSMISCGEDGDSKNNCIISGGNYHFYFFDHMMAKDTWFKGITFEGANSASIFGNAHPETHIVFADCHWRDNLGSSTVYVRYSPGRRLEEGGPSYLDEMYEVTRKEAHALTANKDARDLQELTRFSMSMVFLDCTFKRNDDAIATIYNWGGEIQLFNTSFVENDVAQLAVFSVLGNGHAALSHGTNFKNNFAHLGPVYIDNKSFLRLSRDNFGTLNTGKKCDGIFLEDNLSKCTKRDAQCTGQCCAFGDESCDLYDADSPSAAPSSKPRPVTTPPVSVSVSVSDSTTPVTTSAMSENIKMGGCNGFCIGFSILTVALVIIIGILATVYVRKSVTNKKMSATVTDEDTQEIGQEIGKQID